MRFLLIGRALRSFSQSYLAVLVPLYILDRGATVATAGILVACWAAGGALLGALAGFAADRFGRKTVLFVFSMLTAVSALAFAANLPFWLLAIAGALGTIGRGGGPASGGAFGPYYSAEQALIAELAPGKDRTRAFALFSSVASFCGAMGFLVSAVPTLAFHAVFLFTSAIGVALALSVLPIQERSTRPAQHEEHHDLRLGAQSRGFLLRLAVTNATNGLAVGFLGSMLVLWFHIRYHADARSIGFIYFSIALCISFTVMFVERAVSWIGGAVRTVVTLRVISCGLLAVMPLMPTLWLAGLVYLVRMLFNSITISVRQSYVMGMVPERERARVASLANLPSQATMTIGPSLAGYLLEHLWNGLILELAATLQLLNALLYHRFFHRRPPPEERAA